MKTYRIKHIDAFTTKMFAGNSAGVFLEADGLTDGQMQMIAREKNLAETAFVLLPTTKKADMQIRWFTPTAEVPLCGHATIASFHGLAQEGLAGMKTEGQHFFRLQTKSGILAVRVEKNFHGTTIELELPMPNFKRKKIIPAAMLDALGIANSDVESRMPVVFDSYMYIPLKKLSKLRTMNPNFQQVGHSSRSAKVLGVCLFTVETVEKQSAVHSRFFAPAVGINEDPVTGSANGPLGVYLHEHASPAGFTIASRELSDGRIEYVGEQGDELERPGRVKIRLTVGQRGIEKVSIAGEAVTVMNSTITC